jgi:hypothetical protein
MSADLELLIADDEKAGIGSVSDAEFFRRNPNRTYRMRLATTNEIAAAAIVLGRQDREDDHLLWFMAVKQIAPGIRLRFGFKTALPVGIPIRDIPERFARGVFTAAIGRQRRGRRA